MDGCDAVAGSRRRRRAPLLLCAVGLLSIACSTQPAPRTSETGITAEEAIASTIEASEVSAAKGGRAADEGAATAAGERGDREPAEGSATERASPPRIVVLEQGGEGSQDAKNLVKASRAEQQRRQTAAPAVIVIDDRNLADHATGKLTFTEVGGDPGPAAAATEGGGGEAGGQEKRGEEYWRQGARSLREAWSDAVAAIEIWEERAAELRVRFYSTDDPYLRDGEVKPQWDRALDRLAAAQEEARRSEQALREFIEEGRRAGALPGWLREGIELEPDHFPYEGHVERDTLSREHEVVDPRDLREARSTDPEGP